jgi:LacI family transcriptional regulator
MCPDADRSPTTWPRRATLRDVAALAGVSFKTVSRVVNHEPGVSEHLALRVHDAAARLDYHPNQTAAALRRKGGRSDTIGLLVEDVDNPFFAAIHRGVESVALTHQYAVLTGSGLDDTARERLLVETFARRRIDGLLVSPSGRLTEQVATQRRRGLRVVYIDQLPTVLDADAVVTDNVEGTQGGVAHLIAHGHSRIGFLGDLPVIQTAAARHDGYVAAHADAELAYDPRLVRRNLHSAEAGEDATQALMCLPEPPTALFAAHSRLTVGAVRALQALRRQHEVAFVGFDDMPLAGMLQPPVTVVAQQPETLGRLAAQRLLERVGGLDVDPEVIVVPTRLVVRGSGELAQKP